MNVVSEAKAVVAGAAPRIDRLCFFCEAEHVRVVEIAGRIMTVRVALCDEHKDRVTVNDD